MAKRKKPARKKTDAPAPEEKGRVKDEDIRTVWDRWPEVQPPGGGRPPGGGTKALRLGDDTSDDW